LYAKHYKDRFKLLYRSVSHRTGACRYIIVRRYAYASQQCVDVFAILRCLSLSVCPSVTFVCCIQTAEDMSIFFLGPVAPSFCFFDPERWYQIPRESPSVGAQNTRGICDFKLKSPFISETVRDRPMLIWNVNRKT